MCPYVMETSPPRLTEGGTFEKESKSDWFLRPNIKFFFFFFLCPKIIFFFFFFFCPPWRKPTPTLLGACNQYAFELILKTKNWMSIYSHSFGSSTSVFSSTIFRIWQKTLFLGGANTLFFENVTSSYLHKKIQICSAVLLKIHQNDVNSVSKQMSS